MNEQELTTLLERAAASTSIKAVPMDQITSEDQRHTSRKRPLLVLSAVAVTALAVLGVVVTERALHEGATDETPIASPSSSVSEPPVASPSDEASPPVGVVTTPEELEGKWFAAELYGRDVKPREEERIPVPYLFFSPDPSQAAKPWTWSTNDGCNTMGGQYTVLPDGTFNAQDGWSTLVGCPPVWSMHGANIQALAEADQAVLLPSDLDTADAVDRLVLLLDGETIGVYLAGPRNDPLDTVVPSSQAP